MRTAILLLLLTPDAAPEPCPDVLAIMELQALSVEYEIFSPTTHWTANFATELADVRRTWADCWDCPPLADSERLPTAEVIAGALAWNRAFSANLEARQLGNVGCSEMLDPLREECKRLEQIWQHAELAKSNWSWSCRRQALRRLKEAVGEADFYAGKLPGWCPPMREIR